jgi:hypothetical protein
VSGVVDYNGDVKADETGACMPTVVEMSREEVLAWRASLLAKTKLSEEELFRRGELFQLSAEEMTLYETIKDADYLLSADA